VENGLKVRPTPNTHPQLSRKISAFYEEMFGPKKPAVPLTRPLTKNYVQKNSIMMRNQVAKPADPVLPVITAVTSLNALVTNAAQNANTNTNTNVITNVNTNANVITNVNTNVSANATANVNTNVNTNAIPNVTRSVTVAPPPIPVESETLDSPMVLTVPPMIVVGTPAAAVSKGPLDLEANIPLTSIKKQVQTTPPLNKKTLEMIEKRLNAPATNIALVQHNIHNTLALPIQNFPHRWFMLSVVNDFSDIYIPQWKSYLAYDKIIRAIVMAQRVHKTVQLQSNCRFPQVFAVPETTNRIFLGPYNLTDTVHFKLCQNIDNEMMLREEYEARFGVRRNKKATTGCWLYLKSITARKSVPETGAQPVQSVEPPPAVITVKKVATSTSLLKNPIQRPAVASQSNDLPVVSQLNADGVLVASAAVPPKSASLTSSCVVNSAPVQTPLLAVPLNPVGHLSNQPIFPKFNIQFTTANKTCSAPPATVTAPQRPEAQAPPQTVTAAPPEPMFVLSNFPSVPATTDHRRSSTPVANIDLTDEDGRRAVSDEIDLTSDDEQVAVPQRVQLVKSIAARRKSVAPVATASPRVVLAPQSLDDSAVKKATASTSDLLCDEIRKRLSNQPSVKVANPRSLLTRPAGPPEVKRSPLLPTVATKPTIVTKIVSAQPNLVQLAAIRQMQEQTVASAVANPTPLAAISQIATQLPAKLQLGARGGSARPASPKPAPPRKLPTLKSVMATLPKVKAIADPPKPPPKPTVTVTVLKPIVAEKPNDKEAEKVEPPPPLAKDPDEPEASSSDRVQFGYFVCSFIFLGRFKAKETGDKNYSVKFPCQKPNEEAASFEWRDCGPVEETSRAINE
jgi:hypothetical protein